MHLPSPPSACPQLSCPFSCQDQSSLGSWFRFSELCVRVRPLRGHIGAAHKSEDSPLKPEVIAFWAQGIWFSCPTCFRTDRFCTAQERKISVIALETSLSLFLCQPLQGSSGTLCSSRSSVPLPSGLYGLKLEVATILDFPSDPKDSQESVHSMLAQLTVIGTTQAYFSQCFSPTWCLEKRSCMMGGGCSLP